MLTGQEIGELRIFLTNADFENQRSAEVEGRVTGGQGTSHSSRLSPGRRLDIQVFTGRH